jgi:hypothetical protein
LKLIHAHPTLPKSNSATPTARYLDPIIRGCFPPFLIPHSFFYHSLIRAMRGSLHPGASSLPFVVPSVSLQPFTEVNVASSDFDQETWS